MNETQSPHPVGSSDLVRLTDGDIRFILWALPQADVWTNEGMHYYSRMSEYNWMIERLRARLPENAKPNTEAQTAPADYAAFKS